MFAGVFTFLLWVVLLILAEQDYQIALAGKYVKTCLYPVLEKDGLKPMPGWEAYMERRRRTMTYAVQTAIKYAFVGLPILGIDVLVLGSFVFGQQPATFAHTIYLIVALIRYGIAFLVLKATVDEFRDDHSDCGSASE